MKITPGGTVSAVMSAECLRSEGSTYSRNRRSKSLGSSGGALGAAAGPHLGKAQGSEHGPHENGSDGGCGHAHGDGLVPQEPPDQPLVVAEDAPDAVGEEHTDYEARKDNPKNLHRSSANPGSWPYP